jgi:GTP-binding protein
MVDALLPLLPEKGAEDGGEEITRIAVIGRPNVGKSSLVNRLLGFERVVANPTPGTTRDSVDTTFSWHGRRFTLVDTAGIRRKGKTTEKIEKYSVVDALRSIERCDVVLVVVDAEEGLTEQDARIAGYACDAGRACVIVVNKWDTLEKDNKTIGSYVEKVRTTLRFLAYAPIVFVSAKTGQRTGRIMEEVVRVMEQYERRITTSELNRVFSEATEAHHAPLAQGRRVKFYFSTQVAIKPPTFVVFTNKPDDIPPSYERFLANRFREAYGFDGVPLRLLFRGRESSGREK